MKERFGASDAEKFWLIDGWDAVFGRTARHDLVHADGCFSKVVMGHPRPCATVTFSTAHEHQQRYVYVAYGGAPHESATNRTDKRACVVLR